LHQEYTVRESARAKRVRLRVTVSDGLVVVIPKGFDRRRIPGMLEEKRDWVDRAMKEIEAHRAALPSADGRPEAIELPASGLTWRLEWRKAPGDDVTIAAIGPSRLRLSGSVDDPTAWRSALRGWLLARGREHLIPWVDEMAHALGVRVERVSVRCQKTRWGSYSTRGTISLNAQLLFLPERLVRFVLLHELCHAAHPDHSSSFWDLVRTHEPDADRLRKELRAAWKQVPHWLSAGLARRA
jgi:predicted metal-dependent hydrolase